MQVIKAIYHSLSSLIILFLIGLVGLVLIENSALKQKQLENTDKINELFCVMESEHEHFARFEKEFNNLKIVYDFRHKAISCEIAPLVNAIFKLNKQIQDIKR